MLPLGCMAVASAVYIWMWSKSPECSICGMKTGSEVSFGMRSCLHCRHEFVPTRKPKSDKEVK